MEPKTDPRTEFLATVPTLIGKDEMNWAEIAPTLLTNTPPRQTHFRREVQLFDPKRKQWITGLQIVQASQEYGPPTATDDRVLLALVQLTKEKNGFTSPIVEFVRRELLELLGWTKQGKDYERLDTSLLRLKHVSYEYKRAWFDNVQGTYTTRAFSILSDVEINDSRERNGQGNLFPSRFAWSQTVFESFRAGYLRSIDFDLCMELEQASAVRMYRFLGKRSYLDGRDLSFPLKEFVVIHLGVIGSSYTSKAQFARLLSKGIKELECIKFIVPMVDKDRYFKKDKAWHVRFVLTEEAVQSVSNRIQQQSPEREESPSGPAVELTARGVSAKKAKQLVKDHPEGAIASKIELLEWMLEHQPKKVKNPAAYLIKAIEDDYAPPKGFSTKAEREAKKQAAEEARRKQAEEERRRAAEEARERAIQKAVASYWDELSEDEQARVTEAVLHAMDDEQRASYEEMQPPALKSMYLRRRRESYVRELLEKQGGRNSPPAMLQLTGTGGFAPARSGTPGTHPIGR